MPHESTASIDVAYVAQLARIQLSPEETVTFQKQLSDVLHYVNQLSEVDLSKIERLPQPPIENHLRTDEPRPSLPREVALQNAPLHTSELILMPKVVE
ncbi:MAG: Asp-tRNA(Asn)/Glu-tRNA(Gln) amidotransferase subunit GatC [Methylacidiphilales bacterium]|nr:Asp-tRNA(Asn)/Glu-tRNA(Gln) amidotransferase subunit GatC [Candidatus Methylacidiphilales bacterium]MDW8348846.1 Asp-tRNA(Asn)/Glu-tRNA(Gln) amidotransferase subunit GatC [Verrucomicrobiae bacterium]